MNQWKQNEEYISDKMERLLSIPVGEMEILPVL